MADEWIIRAVVIDGDALKSCPQEMTDAALDQLREGLQDALADPNGVISLTRFDSGEFVVIRADRIRLIEVYPAGAG